MFCARCGKQLDSGVKFCPYCGAMVAGATAPSVDTRPEQAEPSGQPAPEAAPAAPEAAPAVPEVTPAAPVTAFAAPEAAPATPVFAPVPASKKSRNTAVIIGAAVAGVLVVVLAIVALSSIFRSPKGQLERALLKTLDAYADAGERLDLPDLAGLMESKAVSQHISLELNSVNREISGSNYFDVSGLQGLGMRMDTDYNQKKQKMDADFTVFWSGQDLLTVQTLLDGSNLYITSPEFTGNRAYGINTETIGADLDRLGADGGEVDLKEIGFNFFDLVERVSPGEQQVKEQKKAVKDALEQYWDALEVDKGGRESIRVNGSEVNATVYHVLMTKDAMKDLIDAMLDIAEASENENQMRDVLAGMGFDEDALDRAAPQTDLSYYYDELAHTLKETVNEIGDIELDVYVSDGRVSAVEYSDTIVSSKVEIGLRLGGGRSYVDDLSLEISVDGTEFLVESTGNHACRNGVFTDETTIRSGYSQVVSELRYEPKASSGNLEWTIDADNIVSMDMDGQLTAGRDSIDLQLEEISVRAAGSELFSLGAAYYLGPCKEMKVSISSPRMLAEMDEEDLNDLYMDVLTNMEEWSYGFSSSLYDYGILF